MLLGGKIKKQARWVFLVFLSNAALTKYILGVYGSPFVGRTFRFVNSGCRRKQPTIWYFGGGANTTRNEIFRIVLRLVWNYVYLCYLAF